MPFRPYWGPLAGIVMLACAPGFVAGGARAAEAGPQSEAPAADALRALRKEVYDLRLKLLKADAKDEELTHEGRAVDTNETSVGDAEEVPAPALPRLRAREEIWEQARPALGKVTAAAKELDTQRNEASAAEQAAEKARVDAVANELSFRDDWTRFEDLAGRPLDVTAGTGLLGPLAGPIGLGVLAVLGGLALTLHEARDRLRWRFRAAGSRPIAVAAVALAVLVPAVDGCSGPRGGPSALAAAHDRERAEWARARDEKRALLRSVERKNMVAEKRLDGLLDAVRRDRATFGLWPVQPGAEGEARKAMADVARIQKDYRAIRLAALTIRRLDGDRDAIVKERADKDLKLVSIKSEVRRTDARAAAARLAACAVLALAAFVPLQLVRNRRRRGLDEDSRLCPRCESLDTLNPVSGFEPGGGDGDGDGDRGGDDGRKIKDRLFECGHCGLELRENLVRQHRLAFPTIGVRSSGKTHWMVILYDMIKNSNVPVASTVRRIPSREDSRFDQLVRDLLYERRGPEATTTGRLPQPLIFHVHDADPMGANRTTVNLLDFSGEIRRTTIDENEERLRALRCQGFVLFLDATQVVTGPWSESDLTIEDQIQTLARFSEELHAVRGVAPEHPVDLPIAVCISKFDLVSHQNPIGSQAVPFVAQLRETIGRDVDLDLIHERSQLCARAMPLMFPGWNLERTLREQFGGRFMFFPISSVGLEESELGDANLAGRTFMPFGVLEPLLWLLHMHGYCVLH